MSNPEQGVYEILYLDCDKKNMWVNLIVSMNKFMSTQEILKKRDINNGLIKHNLETNPNFNFKDSKMLHNKNIPENC